MTMFLKSWLLCLLGCCFGYAVQLATASPVEPPYHGTIFLEKAIIQDDDPSEFVTANVAGMAERRMFDRRVDKFIEVEARLYRAEFKGGRTVEVQVNSEFSEGEAREAIDFYLPVIGQLPRVLREHVQTVWIHKGDKPFGGGNNNLLIHTEQGAKYARDGILAETLCHEAAHTSLDQTHASNERWLAAQRLDVEFISKYARDNPRREDVAESFLLHLALKYRRDRLPAKLTETVEKTIPNRLKYFDSLTLDMAPITTP